MADGHASRGHAAWSASASERLWACPGSLTLNAGLADKESEAAAWGTAAHEVAERCLRTGNDATHYLGTIVSTKSHKIEVDDEVAECAQVYVDYVLTSAYGTASTDELQNVRYIRFPHGDNPGKDYNTKVHLLVEQKFDLAAINPPFEAGGTGDAVILKPSEGLLEIVDLKGGRGVVVEATGNKQLRTYALGAILANPGPWRTVKATIVQPRAPHPDGRIRSEEFHVADLIDWTTDLLDAMKKAAEAQRYFGGGANWPSLYLKAGTHCTFCKAAATCPALAGRALEEARTFFKPEGGLATPPEPTSLTMAQIVRVLDHADMLQNWLNAVRAYAQDQAEAGHDVTDGTSTYVLTPKRAMRRWKDEDPVLDLGLATGREAADFYQEPKLMTPAMVEKLLGKKGYEAIADLVDKSSSGFNLTRADKTTRGAAVAPAKQFFQIEGGQ
jgi:hypothetical protein